MAIEQTRAPEYVHAAERLFGSDTAQMILAVLSDHGASLDVMLHAMIAIATDEATARDCAELVRLRLSDSEPPDGMPEKTWRAMWNGLRAKLTEVRSERDEARAELAALRERAEALTGRGTYTAEDMRKQGRAGRSIEKAELLGYLRSEADAWRAGVPRDGSIKGHHLPLKHVYRWLDAIERGEQREAVDVLEAMDDLDACDPNAKQCEDSNP